MIDSEESVLARECFLEMWYLNRDLPEVKMQAIKHLGEVSYRQIGRQTQRPCNGNELEEGYYTVGGAGSEISQSCWGHIMCRASVHHLVV